MLPCGKYTGIKRIAMLQPTAHQSHLPFLGISVVAIGYCYFLRWLLQGSRHQRLWLLDYNGCSIPEPYTTDAGEFVKSGTVRGEVALTLSCVDPQQV